MKKYECILKRINLTDKWESDESFLIDVISKSSIKMIEICYEDLEKGNLIPILPILRLVQENCILLIGFGDSVITAKEFQKGKLDAQKIFERLENKENLDSTKVIFVSDYLKEIKKLLNNYSHTNFDGLMQLFIEDYQVYEAKKFNELIIKFAIAMVEIVLISGLNYYYKVKIEFPNISNFNRDLKEIGSLRYIADKLPKNISDFIKNSEIFKSYYRNLGLKTKENIKLLKEIKIKSPKIS